MSTGDRQIGRPGSSGWPPLVASAVAACVLGLVVTPAGRDQGDLVRLIYVHPAVSTVGASLAFGVTALASLLYLWPRTRSRLWDRLAGASAEVGVVFCALTPGHRLIWGRPVVGGVVDLGRPPDPHRPAAGAVPRLPGPAPHRRPIRGPGQALGRRRRCCAPWCADRPLRHRPGGGPSTRATPC